MKGKNKKESAYLILWIIIVVPFVLFIFLSFDWVYQKEHPYVKKSTFKDVLLAEAPETDTLPALTEEMWDMQEGRLKEAKPDTTVKTIMVFGDSMTILVANRLAAYGAKNGYEVVSVTWYSSSTEVWGKTDTLTYFINQYKPDFIMATLGSNELFIRNIETRSNYVESLLKEMGDIPFVWIGPPNWKKDTGINDMLEKTVSPQRFFRTDGMDLPRGGDKVHPTQKGADTWTDSIMRWMPSTPHPILSEFPDSVPKKLPHTIKLLAPPS